MTSMAVTPSPCLIAKKRIPPAGLKQNLITEGVDIAHMGIAKKRIPPAGLKRYRDMEAEKRRMPHRKKENPACGIETRKKENPACGIETFVIDAACLIFDN